MDRQKSRLGRILIVATASLVALIFLARLLPGGNIESERAPLSQRPVTSLAGEEFDPVFAPDGSRIAFARIADLEGPSDIYAMSLDGSDLIRLTATNANESSPAFSADSRFVAFIRCDYESGAAGIYSTSSAGTGQEQQLAEIRVSNCMATPQISWSPDGNRIAYSEPDSTFSSSAIYALDVTSGTRTPLTNPAEGLHDGYPRYSPDGRRIAFTRERSPIGVSEQLFVSNSEGGGLRALTDGTLDVEGLDWTADGRKIVVASRGTIWEIDAVSAERSWVAAPGFDIVQPAVSRSDGRLIFVQSLYDVNIWSLDVKTPESAYVMIASTRVDNDPRISPDGLRIAYISDRSGICSVLVSNRVGEGVLTVASFDENCWNVRDPRWSPDGLNLAFEVADDTGRDVYVVSTVGGPVRALTDSPADDYAPGWSADGNSVYVSSDRSGTTDIWRVPLDGEAPVRVTFEGGLSAEESDDGEWIYFNRPDEDGIWRQSVAGGKAVKVVDDLEERDSRNWRIGNGAITYIRRGPSPEIVRFDLNSAERSVVVVLPTSLYNCARADLSPDGTYAVFAQTDRDEDDLVLLENYR